MQLPTPTLGVGHISSIYPFTYTPYICHGSSLFIILKDMGYEEMMMKGKKREMKSMSMSMLEQ
jgi:hypothetical protein